MKIDNRTVRSLVLDNVDRLGERDGPNSFRLHWEFWLQLQMFFGEPLGNIIMPKKAEKLAEIIDKLYTTESGQVHVYMWGDEDGMTAKSLCKFLRGGPFQVVDASTSGDSCKVRKNRKAVP